MRRAAKFRRGYAFLAALGVMAVVFLVVFAMSESTQFSYYTVGQTHKRIQGRLALESAAQYALSLIARGEMGTDGTARSFRLTSNRLRHTQIEVKVSARKVAADNGLYKSTGLAYRPGDVLIRVESESLRDRYGTTDRLLLCNASGLRPRPIDVTGILRSAPTR